MSGAPLSLKKVICSHNFLTHEALLTLEIVQAAVAAGLAGSTKSDTDSVLPLVVLSNAENPTEILKYLVEEAGHDVNGYLGATSFYTAFFAVFLKAAKLEKNPDQDIIDFLISKHVVIPESFINTQADENKEPIKKAEPAFQKWRSESISTLFFKATATSSLATRDSSADDEVTGLFWEPKEEPTAKFSS